jgi:hypothetical protein
MAIDPYHEWLGIPPEEQPPNHYRLLGIKLYEASQDVIANAADRQMIFVRQFQIGKHQEESQRLLNEIAAAKICLLNPTSKAIYDEGLWGDLVAQPPPAPVMLSAESSPIAARAAKQLHPHALKIFGFIAVPIVSLTMGWVILQQMSPGSHAPDVAASTSLAQNAMSGKIHPTGQEDPFELKPDFIVVPPESVPQAPAHRLPEFEEPPVEASVEPPPPPLSSRVEQIIALKQQHNAALLSNNLSVAIQTTEQLAMLEETDSLSAKLETLKAFQGKTDPSLLVEHCISVLDTAVEQGNKLVAQRAAELALLTARQSDDSALVRRATLGVLKAQKISQPEGVTP